MNINIWIVSVLIALGGILVLITSQNTQVRQTQITAVVDWYSKTLSTVVTLKVPTQPYSLDEWVHRFCNGSIKQ